MKINQKSVRFGFCMKRNVFGKLLLFYLLNNSFPKGWFILFRYTFSPSAKSRRVSEACLPLALTAKA